MAKEETPFERMMNNLLHGTLTPSPLGTMNMYDYSVLVDSIVACFFRRVMKDGKRIGLEGLMDYAGIRVEFSSEARFTYIRRDKKENFKVIVLPDQELNEESKQQLARQAIKEFDCLETLEKYELCQRMLQSFSHRELQQLVQEYDPLKRSFNPQIDKK